MRGARDYNEVMSVAPPIPIPEEFDSLSVADKKAFLAAVRARLEQSLEASEADLEEAILDVVDFRRREVAEGRRRLLSRDELMGPLRAKYAKG